MAAIDAFDDMFNDTMSDGEHRALTAASQAPRFAAVGLIDGQTVTYQNDTWTVETVSADLTEVMLCNPRRGFFPHVNLADIIR